MEKILKLYKDNVAFPNVDDQIIIADFTYNASRMSGAPTISATIKYKDCLDNEWSDEVFTEFNGEKYHLKNTPSSSYSNQEALYKHEATFVSERAILDNILFFDVVAPNVNEQQKPVSNSSIFAFHGDVNELANRLNYSMTYSNVRKVDSNGNYVSGYNVVVDKGIKSEKKMISISNMFVTNALQEIYNQYELPYYFDGKTIHIGFDYISGYSGSDEDPLVTPFEYGVDNSLLSITKNNSGNKIVTRVSGIGSEENIQYYYPNRTPKGDEHLFYNGVEDTENQYLKLVNPFRIEHLRETDTFEYVVEPYKYEDHNISYHGRPDNDNNPDTWVSSGPDGKVWERFPNRMVSWVYDFRFEVKEQYENLTFSIVAPYLFIANKKKVSVLYESQVSIFCNGERKYIKTANGNSDENQEEPFSNIPWSDFGVGGYLVRVEIPWHDHPHSDYEIDNLEIRMRFQTPEKRYWLRKNDELDDSTPYYNLEYFGIKELQKPNNGDTFYFKFDQRIQPIKNLVPPIYKNSFGKERFFNAVNYPIEFATEEELKAYPLNVEMGEYIKDGQIHNDYYINKDTGLYYIFDNPFEKETPREHLCEFSDIKPTIKETIAKDNMVGGLLVSGLRQDMFSEFAYDTNDSDEKTVDDDNSKYAYKHPFFYGRLRKLQFNLFESLLEGGGEVEFAMTSGHCGGCKFKLMVDENGKHNPVEVDSDGNLLRDDNGNVKRGGTPNSYPLQQDTSQYEVWVCLMKEEETYGVVMPSKERNITPLKAGRSTNDGDTFVILNINLPQSYIDAAEDKLAREVVKYMHLNNTEKFSFNITFSRIFFAENPKVLEALNENVRIKVKYNEQVHDLYVYGYTYKMSSNNPLPEITVSLKDEITVSQNALQQAISEVEHDIMSGIGSIDWLRYGREYFLRKDVEDVAMAGINFQTRATFGIWEEGVSGANIDASGHEEVDSIDVRKTLQIGKNADDYSFKVDENGNTKVNTISNHNDSFKVDENGNMEASTIIAKNNGGIMSDNLELGTQGKGFALMKEDVYGHSYLEVDKLLVRLKAIFTELQIHNIKYSGGSFIFSPAGMTVSRTEICYPSDKTTDKNGEQLKESGYEELSTIDDSKKLVYRCYFTNKDGETKVKNEFAVGDLVRSQSFNVANQTTNAHENTYCWRECVGVGYDYIDLYYDNEGVSEEEHEKHRADESNYPQEGDNLVTFGNISDPARQNLIYMNAYGGTEYGMEEAPCIIQYAGVNSFDYDELKQKIVSKISPNGNVFTGDFIIQDGDDKGTSLLDFTTNKFALSIQETKKVQTEVNTVKQDTVKVQDEVKAVKLELTPDNIAIKLTKTNVIHNLFVDGSLDNGIAKISGAATRVKRLDSAYGEYCLITTHPIWIFSVGYGKVGNNKTYSLMWSMKTLQSNTITFFNFLSLQWSATEDFTEVQEIPITSVKSLNTEWQRYLFTFNTNADTLGEGYVRLASVMENASGLALLIDGIMLVQGEVTEDNMPEYTEYVDENLRKDLLKTGIDIEHQKITLTADTFEVKNNDGETTAKINDEGVLEMNSGVFKGRLSLPFRQLLLDGSVEQNQANGFEPAIKYNDYQAVYRIKDINKGANICVIGGTNQQFQDAIVLPVQPEYNGTLVTIIKATKNKVFNILTNAESDELKLNYDEIYNGFGDGDGGYYGFISHGTCGKSIRMESDLDYEVLELMAVKIVPDYTETDEELPNYGKTYKGVCAWMILNPEKFNYSDRWYINGEWVVYHGYESKASNELLENRIKALENKLAN